MMLPLNDIENWIKQIHNKSGKIVLVTTGAGMLAQSWLFGVAGASRTVLECRVPYAKQAFDLYVGREPEKYVSFSGGRLLAAHAFRRAKELVPTEDEPLFGVSCTAAITTDRPKQGAHHAVVSVWSRYGGHSIHLNMNKGMRTRQDEEVLVSCLIIYLLAETFQLSDLPPIRSWLPLIAGDELQVYQDCWRTEIGRLLKGKIAYVAINDDGLVKTAEVNPPLLLSGSFNPLHKGHLKLAKTAAQMTGKPVAFELSAYNVDKPPLDIEVLLPRLSQFAGSFPLYVTNAPTFWDKARLLPQTTFVVGYDTAIRIFNPHYYQGCEDTMMTALNEIRELGCHFLVAGRVDKEGVFRDAADLAPPSAVADLFTPIPSDYFRQDISSTELRERVGDHNK